MPEPEQPVPEIYVQPGESHLVSGPAVLRTVLGSCVGITFLVPRLGIAALCHPMLPQCPRAQPGKISPRAGRRYVDFAIHDMVRQLVSFGASRAETEVKLFGGGDVLAVVHDSGRPSVGKLNSEAALQVLREEGFHISASRMGGRSGVHIQFTTATGEVLVRRLDRAPMRPGSKSRRNVDRCESPR
jgi:chemotaxis protein CheD